MGDTMAKDITRLETELQGIRQRITQVEENDKRHEEDIRLLYANQEGTKVYVTQILNKLEALESKLFTLVTQLTQNQEADRQADRRSAEKVIKESAKATTSWQDLIKFIINITLGVIIMYLFSQAVGGK